MKTIGVSLTQPGTVRDTAAAGAADEKAETNRRCRGFTKIALRMVTSSPELTTRLNTVVRPRGVPVTVIGTVPVGVDELVEMVNCVEQVGVQAVGVKEAVAPLGSPEAEKETLWLEPAVRVAVIVVEPAVPCITVIPPELDSV